MFRSDCEMDFSKKKISLKLKRMDIYHWKNCLGLALATPISWAYHGALQANSGDRVGITGNGKYGEKIDW